MSTHRYELCMQESRELHAWWIALARIERQLGNHAAVRYALRRCADNRRRLVVYARQLKLIGVGK